MNRKELIDAISEETGDTKASVSRFLDSLINTVQNAVAQGDKVTLVGFGCFDSKKLNAREGRNPATGEPIKIEASTKARFVPGSVFRDMVNNR